MKNILLATGLFVTFGSAMLTAQTTRLTADIPFDFHMGKTSMPAGEYSFQRQSGMLTIRAADGKHTAMTLTSPASRDLSDSPVVKFQHYGDTYFLSGLFIADSRDGFSVAAGEKQRELAKRMPTTDTTIVALSRK